MDAGMESRNEPSEKNPPEENHTQAEIPEELWERIISKLTLKDNIRTSAVSKRFLSIATSVQKANKPPWLVIPAKFSDSYELYDPSKRKSYSLELSELRDARFVHSKDGWLLMSNPKTLGLFLFCPYTRELIQLPEFPDDLSLEPLSAAFSAAPTSSKCMLLSIHAIDLETIQFSTFRPGETKWTNFTYHDDEWKFSPSSWDKLLFCNGFFYFFNCFNDAIGIYNPDEISLRVEDIPRPEGPVIYDIFTNLNPYWRNVFMVEHDGEIIITYTLTNRSPVIYKLDLPNHKLVEMETLGGMTLFISDLSSHVRTDLLGNLRNNVYLPKLQPDGERCISYSFDKGEYFHENQLHYWTDIDRFDSIWIDAPEDISTLL